MVVNASNYIGVEKGNVSTLPAGLEFFSNYGGSNNEELIILISNISSPHSH